MVFGKPALLSLPDRSTAMIEVRVKARMVAAENRLWAAKIDPTIRCRTLFSAAAVISVTAIGYPAYFSDGFVVSLPILVSKKQRRARQPTCQFRSLELTCWVRCRVSQITNTGNKMATLLRSLRIMRLLPVCNLPERGYTRRPKSESTYDDIAG